ncbi:GDP-mannose-dependent alpha-mannosyltransferase [Aedoeadaptatus ivorii]|uniref:GDP-mannose-dependent alpha-mannosyltransferase n=1 Tax=Aedoeadaptatus ivorii TaxID=54006 RepID=A0A448UZW0_9FIRM|nr:glycosyltransferase family 4 protein [Peptoniphilus ivorii]VEJ34400.1 GDP-mannose-dependent alpha-mannosyltransferase [Peptoniphilus ivorii]
MRIGLFTDTYYPEINGVANSTYMLRNALEAMGHTVYVITSRVSGTESSPEEHIYRIPSIKPYLVKDRHLALVVEPYWKHKGKQMELDVIHTQTEFTVGMLGMRIAQKFGIPLVHSYHTMYEDYTHYFHVPKSEKLKPVVRMLSAKFCNYADGVIVPTDKVRKKLHSYKVYRDVYVVPTGLDPAKYGNCDANEVERLRARYGLESGYTLLYIGRLAEEKNIDQVIDHYKKLEDAGEDVNLLIVGDGPVRGKLEKQARDLRIRNIAFTGAVPWEEIQNYYALGDLFVSASTSETQGLTYNEALASGLPILVRRDPCLEQVLREGENGMGFVGEEEFLKGYRAIRALPEGLAPEAYTDRDFAQEVLAVYKEISSEAMRHRA